jgi:hypothetical protein
MPIITIVMLFKAKELIINFLLEIIIILINKINKIKHSQMLKNYSSDKIIKFSL